jgi:hypothetical protein
MSGPSKRCSRGLRTLHSKCVLHYHCLVVDISVAIRHYGQSMMGLTYYCNMKGYVKHAGWKALKSFFPLNFFFGADSSCRDRALLVLGSNTAEQAPLTALLDPSTHFRPPLTHTSHHRPVLVALSRFIAVLSVSHSRFVRFSTCISAVSGVSLVGVSLLSADVAVALVRPEVISQRVFISRGRTRAHWKALVEAHTIVQYPRIRQNISSGTIWASALELLL